MKFLSFMRKNAIKPMWWCPETALKYARFTKICLPFLLIVLLMLVLSGCSKAVSVTPIQPLPANLASNCPPLPEPPKNLVDPDRSIWELEIIAKYGDCALKHRMAVSSWPKK